MLKYADPNKQSPISMSWTEHHFLFVYADKFQSVRRLDEAVVFEQALPQRIGKVLPLRSFEVFFKEMDEKIGARNLCR